MSISLGDIIFKRPLAQAEISARLVTLGLSPSSPCGTFRLWRNWTLIHDVPAAARLQRRTLILVVIQFCAKRRTARDHDERFIIRPQGGLTSAPLSWTRDSQANH